MRNTIILDSSDDEVGFDDSSTADNFDWISKLLEDVPTKDDASCTLDVACNGADDDSDDVVVVGEVLVQPKRGKVSMPINCDQRFDDDDDDDCVVLDSDPDKPEEAPEMASEVGEGKGSDEDSDDLVIVGEKGQVACRDYPHSRHLCAKFPFGSTPHGSHCDLCHCYVCDSLAPCAYWGSGDSSLDHCCATDKVEYWKNERKKMRESKNPSAAIPKPTADSLARLPQMQQTSVRSAPIPRPASTCGVSSSFGAPNIISHSRNQRPLTIPRIVYQPQQVSCQLLRTCKAPAQSNRNLRTPSLVSSRPAFKRSSVYTGRTRVVNPSTYIPPKETGSYWQQLLNQPLVGKSAEFNSVTLLDSSPRLGGVNLSTSQPLVSNISMATLPSHMRSYNNSVAQTPSSSFQVYGQSTVGTSSTIGTTDSPWVYSSGSRTQNSSLPVFPCNTANAVDSVKLSTQQASAVEQNVSGPTFSGDTSGGLSGTAPSIHRPSEAANDFSHSAYPFNTSNSINNMAQSFQQQSVEKPQSEDAVPLAGNAFVPSVEHDNPPVSACMNSSPLEFDLDSWLPENDSLLGGQYGSDLFDVSNESSVPPSIDAGMLLFDFETSWNGLAHS